ncbi:CRISPR-associated endonuclease Cas2 [Vandammella animalimorsus]|uniref:CRISPR-associated endoribonuclease Cas2 n=1 Tax=Vandammella animalimorsus TaxID=2029117 RepID=A0A2A2AY06_9BURK|nr:CRISPR-associated endonuclease Cas2 [Vandammella animalimorsus]PAT36471.1 CRISPR-associated protein Cas2 [Vandammella animalimorsus]PAT42647.1 CRISPR-associated protein Cas2 [Vandammella animalimorsus]
MARTLYLVAYDIACDRTRLRIQRYLKSFRVAGQKSVPEIWVTPAELRAICADLQRWMDAASDRILLIALDPRLPPHCLGQASSFRAGYFAIV